MTLAVAPPIGQVKAGDSAELYSALRINEQPVSPDQIEQVNFIIARPNGTRQTNIGLIEDDGRGFFRWMDTNQAGEYLVQAQFTLVTGEIRSVMSSFSVVNPFADLSVETTLVGTQTFPTTTVNVLNASGFPTQGLLYIPGVQGLPVYTGTTPTSFTGVTGGMGTAISGAVVGLTSTPTEAELITEGVWARLSDLFDSVDGGPWLREKTLSNFDENKIGMYIAEALLDINTQMPPTNMTLDNFTAWSVFPGDNPNMPLLIKGVLCLAIRHLARS
jgi:hypothetical protein